MAMTPSEKKYHELRKENKVLKKEITELSLQVKFITERLEIKNEQLITEEKFHTKIIVFP